MRPGLHCNRANKCRPLRQFCPFGKSGPMPGSRARARAFPANAAPLPRSRCWPSAQLYSTGLSASYLLDFWGKTRATLYAAEENATVARYNREIVTLTAIVTVANTYFQILAAQDQLRVTRQNLAASDRILALVRNRF